MRKALPRTLAVALAFAVVPVAVHAQFDPAKSDFPYTQPDPAGDVFPVAQVSWADVTQLAITTLEDGSVLIRLKFVDLSLATGDMRYCVFFKVEETTYQAGWRGQLVAGTPNGAATSCTWNGLGTSVGVPAWDLANDQVRVTIPPDAIEGLAPGVLFKAITVHIGAVVTGVGQGQTNVFDVLLPSVDPKDFAYGSGGGVPEAPGVDLTLDAAATEAAAEAGAQAQYAFTVLNNGTEEAPLALSVADLPDGYGTAFDPASPSVGPGSSVDVTLTVTVPASASPGSVSFLVNVTSGNASVQLPLSLQVTSSSGGSTASSIALTTAAGGTSASDESGGGGVPGPGVAWLLAVLVIAGALLRRRRA